MQGCPDDARVPERAAALVGGQALLCDYGIEIGSSFGPLHGKIRRIGAMVYNASEDTVLTTLAGLDSVLATQSHHLSRSAGVDAAQATYALALALAQTQRRAAPVSVFPNGCLPRLT